MSPTERKALLSRIEARFNALADPAYAAFSRALNPTPRVILGVRAPAMRKLAAELMRARESEAFLSAIAEAWASSQHRATPTHFGTSVLAAEFTNLGAILIGRDKHLSLELRYAFFETWLEQMDGWGTCDTLGSEAHFVRTDAAHWLDWSAASLSQVRAASAASIWRARVALVILLAHFKAPDYLERVCDQLSSLALDHALRELASHDALAAPKPLSSSTGVVFPEALGYYLSMAVAWCWATLITQSGERATKRLLAELDALALEPTTARRVVRKVRESRAVPLEVKDALRAQVLERLK